MVQKRAASGVSRHARPQPPAAVAHGITPWHGGVADSHQEGFSAGRRHAEKGVALVCVHIWFYAMAGVTVPER